MTTNATDKPKRFGWAAYLLGILLIISLMAIPLLLLPGSQFTGSDTLGANTIAQIAPDYNFEWATNWWSPPGTETESALFALQAAAGGILIGYFFGYLRGKKAGSKEVGSRE
ncbi:MAG: energy-coupling factor ABC transporter substrate-binding protein [Anaerolineae bacterium]